MLWLSLATVTTGYSLNEWIHDDIRLPMYLLHEFVPPPANPQPTYAFSRFSLGEAFQRWFRNEDQFEQPRATNDILHNTEKWQLSEIDMEALQSDPYKLGMAYFWDIAGIGRNLTKAVELFEQAASTPMSSSELYGDGDAMFMLGVAYSTGLLGVIPENQAKATMYYTFAADSGSLEAEIALGHRYRYGIHAPQDLDEALKRYSVVGNTLLADGLMFHNDSDDQTWYYSREQPQYYAFGAQTDSGLYGRNIYRQLVPPSLSTRMSMGDISGPWKTVSALLPNEFTSLSEAIDSLVYRAHLDDDPVAMFTLARVYAGQGQWKLAIKWIRQCYESLHSDIQIVERDSLSSMCEEFMAERYLHGEGVSLNLTNSHLLYQKAAKRKECPTCKMGMVLAEWREALAYTQNKTSILTLPEAASMVSGTELNHDAILSRFEYGFNTTHFFDDYTLAMKLSEMYLALDRPQRAAHVLRRVLSHIHKDAPYASLMLAYIRNLAPDALKTYVNGVYGLQDIFAPTTFGTMCYENGDVESAVLAFLVSAELGVSSAKVNLADLLDTRHSYAGSILPKSLDGLRKSLSEWPLPKFVSVPLREALALKYFLLSSIDDQFDSLAKAIEACPSLSDAYLSVLQRHNLGMAHFAAGVQAFKNRYYESAMKLFSKTMITPEAWVPAKIAQFFTALKLLPKGLTGTDRISKLYRSIVAMEVGGAPSIPADVTWKYFTPVCLIILVGLVRWVAMEWLRR